MSNSEANRGRINKAYSPWATSLSCLVYGTILPGTHSSIHGAWLSVWDCPQQVTSLTCSILPIIEVLGQMLLYVESHSRGSGGTEMRCIGWDSTAQARQSLRSAQQTRPVPPTVSHTLCLDGALSPHTGAEVISQTMTVAQRSQSVVPVKGCGISV